MLWQSLVSSSRFHIIWWWRKGLCSMIILAMPPGRNSYFLSEHILSISIDKISTSVMSFFIIAKLVDLRWVMSCWVENWNWPRWFLNRCFSRWHGFWLRLSFSSVIPRTNNIAVDIHRLCSKSPGHTLVFLASIWYHVCHFWVCLLSSKKSLYALLSINLI